MVAKENVLKLSAMALSISLLMLVLAVVGLLIFIHEWNQHTVMLADRLPLIVISTMHGYGPGVMLGGATGCLLFLLYFVYRCVLKKETSFFKKAEKALTMLMLASLLVLFGGNFLVASHWRSQADQAGYAPCPMTTLLSNRITMEVWVHNESLCYDNDIRHLVQRGTIEEVQQVQQHLAARHKQQEARLRFLQQEEKLKQRRRNSDG